MTELAKEIQVCSEQGLRQMIADETDEARLWKALEQVIERRVGVSLFTVLIHDEGNGTVQRIYTNDPITYPIGGTKEMGTTPWGDLVLKKGLVFLGQNETDLKWAFPDHETIFSLGLGSALNVPVRVMGATYGTLNLLHRPFHYTTDHLNQVSSLASVIAPLCVRRVLLKKCREA